MANLPSEEEFKKLVKPMHEANLAFMKLFVEDPEINAIVKEARAELKIPPKRGRKPNTEETLKDYWSK